MNHPSTCLPRESGIQGCRSPTLGIQPHRAWPPSSSAAPPTRSLARHPPHHAISSPPSYGIFRRWMEWLLAYVDTRLVSRTSARGISGGGDGEPWRRGRNRGIRRRGRVVDAGEQDSYADTHTEAALESLNVIRLKGF